MTIADDTQNPRPQKKLAKSVDALTALRQAMERHLAEARDALRETARTAPPEAALPPAPPDETPGAETPAAEVRPPALSPEADAPVIDIAAPIEAVPEPLEREPKPTITPPPQPKTSSPPPAAPLHNATDWSHMFMRVAEHSRNLWLSYLTRNRGLLPKAQAQPFDTAAMLAAFAKLTGQVMNDPQRFIDAQFALWRGYTQIWQGALARLQGAKQTETVAGAASDKRFKAADWQQSWLFDYLKQIYLLTAQEIHGWIKAETATLSPGLARKIDFYTRQMVDAASPSNFWLTNPEVLRTAYETNGETLIKGLENLLTDLERGNGRLQISMADMGAFEVGKNIATTAGEVVFQNELIQLIQYAPVTGTVHAVPLLIAAPWINKFYVLDLQARNSFVLYLVEQGYTVFVISWVNPDTRHAQMNFEDYMESGMLAALRAIKRQIGVDAVNVVGYCIGGTLLASTLAYLDALPRRPADVPQIASATYLVTMIDFSEPGDLGVFIDEDMVTATEARMAEKGYFDAASMATAFNLLRANDLIWSFVVNNYLLGKDKLPFDILYWNADATNLPAAMQSYYLRNMYMANKLIEPNGLSMKGVPLDLRRITTPSFLLSTREDHIAPWKSTYAATQIYGGAVTFVLSGSGHIAGIVNAPVAEKYGYWTNAACPPKADDWLASAEAHPGSWWPAWLRWLAPHAGDQVPAREITGGIEPAPGSYVKVKAVS